jgi:hypothetical protein
VFAKRDPENAVGKVATDLLIAGERNRQDGLSDPALPVQPKPPARHAKCSRPLAEQTHTRGRQLSAIDEPRRQGWNIDKLSLSRARQRANPSRLVSQVDTSIRMIGRRRSRRDRGQPFDQTQADLDDRAVAIARLRERLLRVVGPLHFLEHRDLLPQAWPHQHIEQGRALPNQRR